MLQILDAVTPYVLRTERFLILGIVQMAASATIGRGKMPDIVVIAEG